MNGWRYIAQRLNGDGTATWLHWELPITGATVTDTLSGPGALSGSISPEYLSLVAEDGQPILQPWSTAIWAEASGQIRGGGILVTTKVEGPSLSLDCSGFAAYPTGMPYTGDTKQTQADPLDMVRLIWNHLQTQTRGDLGMVLDATTTPVRIGTKKDEDDADSGPYILAWYQTDDLGQEIDNLATETPFDYHEAHTWNTDKTAIVHRLQLGYPRLGKRRSDLRFVVGENVTAAPAVEYNGDDYGNAVLALGAGEGRDMIRSNVTVNDGRLRRIRVFEDKGIRKKARLTDHARKQLAMLSTLGDITDVAVRESGHAQVGTWAVGDEILLEGEDGWSSYKIWCRILSSTISPDDGDVAQLTLQRADREAT